MDDPTPFARKELVGNRVLLTPIRNKNRLGQKIELIDTKVNNLTFLFSPNLRLGQEIEFYEIKKEIYISFVTRSKITIIKKSTFNLTTKAAKNY